MYSEFSCQLPSTLYTLTLRSVSNTMTMMKYSLHLYYNYSIMLCIHSGIQVSKTSWLNNRYSLQAVCPSVCLSVRLPMPIKSIKNHVT